MIKHPAKTLSLWIGISGSTLVPSPAHAGNATNTITIKPTITSFDLDKKTHVPSFTIHGPTNTDFVVERSTDLQSWTPLSITNNKASTAIVYVDATNPSTNKINGHTTNSFYQVIPLPQTITGQYTVDPRSRMFRYKVENDPNYTNQTFKILSAPTPNTKAANWVTEANNVPGGTIWTDIKSASKPQNFYRTVKLSDGTLLGTAVSGSGTNMAGAVDLIWDKALDILYTDPVSGLLTNAIAGYEVYVANAGITNRYDAGNPTNGYWVTKIKPGTNTFKVTSRTSAGIESLPSKPLTLFLKTNGVFYER